VQRLEPAQDRAGGCARELLPDHLKHQRSPQVARPAVEERVGVEPGVADGREHAIELLDALNAPEFQPWTLVDAAWTSKPRSAVSTGNKNGA